MAATTYYLNLIAGHVYGTKTTPPLPASYYLALSTTDPATVVTEPVGGNYARMALTDLSEPVAGVVSNTKELRSNKASTNWGTITHYAVYDAETDGNLLMHDKLNRDRLMDIDTVLLFEVGELDFMIQNPQPAQP